MKDIKTKELIQSFSIEQLKELIIESFINITKLRNKKNCQYQTNINIDTKQGVILITKEEL